MPKHSTPLIAFLFCILMAAPAPALSESTPSTNSDADYLVIPGKSCGKIALGMSKEEVVQILGGPTKKMPAETKEAPEIWSYEAKDNWVHILFGNNKVVQIDFTSPSFKTEEGFGTDLKKVEGNISAFSSYEIPWRFMHLRYQDKKGGLSFYVINADSSDEEYKVTKVGSVHKGSRPIAEAFGLSEEPNAGWRPAKKSPVAPLAERELLPNTTMQKDLGGGYSYCQHTDKKGIVTASEVLHGKEIVDSHAPDGGTILPLLADAQGTPVSKDLDGDGVPDLALLFAEDRDPTSYLLRVTPLKGDKLQNKFYEKFYGKKPVVLPTVKAGQLGLLATDDTYVYSFGDVSNSPEPLIRVRWFDKYPFKLSIDEMKKPPLSQDDLDTLKDKLQRTATVKDGAFRISQELLQSVFDLIYSGRAEDAKKLTAGLWPEKLLGQWSGGPLIDRDQFWLEVTERLAESPFFDEVEKMNGETTRWQTAFK